MAERVLLDNDVALKVACYGLVGEAVAATTLASTPPAMLGVGRFVIRRRLGSTRLNLRAPKVAANAFDALLALVSTVEPDEAEVAIAAGLEAEATRRDLELDSGESQLLAILINRTCDLLLTGDKRAITAIAAIAPAAAANRIACLEQLISQISTVSGVGLVRGGVCSEPSADRAISICFGCNSVSSPSDADIFAGLKSYVDHVAISAPKVLVLGGDLSALQPAP